MKSKLLLAKSAILLLIVVVAHPSAAENSRAETRAQCHSECDTSNAPMCANNGITYTNSCRFNCAKKFNIRLKFVKTGSCAGTTLREYRGQTSRPPTAAPVSRNSGGSSSWDSWFRF